LAATAYPRSASMRATLRPMPRAAPVTTATLALARPFPIHGYATVCCQTTPGSRAYRPADWTRVGLGAIVFPPRYEGFDSISLVLCLHSSIALIISATGGGCRRWTAPAGPEDLVGRGLALRRDVAASQAAPSLFRLSPTLAAGSRPRRARRGTSVRAVLCFGTMTSTILRRKQRHKYAIHLAETKPPNTPFVCGTVTIPLPLDSFSNVRLE
jgi:hypothetical protein